MNSVNNKNKAHIRHSRRSLKVAGLKTWLLCFSGVMAFECDAESLPLVDPAGSLIRDIEKQKESLTKPPPEKKAPIIKDKLESEDFQASDEPVLLLQGIRFTTSEHLTKEELETLVHPWLGKVVSYKDLQSVLRSINQLYRVKGIYTSKAVFPEQRIEDGIVSIRLVEGRFGALVVADTSDEDDKEYYRKWLNTDWHKDSIDVEALERDVLFYNRVHGQRLQAELAAGKAFGLTDVILRIPESEQGFSFHVDNHGAQSTGKEQFTFLYQKTSVLSPGDKLLGYSLLTAGIKSLSGSYNRVMGHDGWRLGGSFQYTDSEWELADFDQDIALVGDSIRFSLDSSYLAWSAQDAWLNLLFSGNTTHSQNKVADELFSEFRTDRVQAGAELTWLSDNWQLVGKLLFSRGKSLSLVNNVESYASLWNPSAVSAYSFTDDWYLKSALEAQWTSDKGLPASLGFSQGGAYSIRGYPESIAGDTGWRVQNELIYSGYRIYNNPIDTYLFFDYGEVTNIQHKQELASTGIGGMISFDWGSLTLTAAQTLKAIQPFGNEFEIYARISFTDLWRF